MLTDSPYVAGTFEYGVAVMGDVALYTGRPGVNATESMALLALGGTTTNRTATADGLADPRVFGSTPGVFVWDGVVSWSVDIGCGRKAGSGSATGAVRDGNCRLSVTITDVATDPVSAGTPTSVTFEVANANPGLPLTDLQATVYDMHTQLPLAGPVPVAANGTFTVPFTATLATSALALDVSGTRDAGTARAVGFDPATDLCSASAPFTLTVVPVPPSASYDMAYCLAGGTTTTTTTTNQLTVSWVQPSPGSAICTIQVTQVVETSTHTTLTTPCNPITGADLVAQPAAYVWANACDGSEAGFK